MPLTKLATRLPGRCFRLGGGGPVDFLFTFTLFHVTCITKITVTVPFASEAVSFSKAQGKTVIFSNSQSTDAFSVMEHGKSSSVRK